MATNLIDVDLWDRARWRGVAYGRGGPQTLPYVALVYQNRDAAAEIFRSWHDLIGPADTQEQIRLAIIEGDIPGKDPGYTVHISPDFKLLMAKTPSSEKNPIGFFTRQLRMNDAASRHLAWFKQAVAQEPRYLLMAGALND